VVAGLPVGCAATVAEALTSMNRPDVSLTAQEWADRVHAAGPPGFEGPWPRISIWQGQDDKTVVPANADLLIAQWTALHGVLSPIDAPTPFMARRQIWGNPSRPVVEAWTIPYLAHGMPIDATRPGGGQTGPWVLDAGLSAADAILSFWGVTTTAPAATPVF
jgi:feruloyl esterase